MAVTGASFRFEKMTWPDVREAARAERLVLIPAGTIEDHGHHLPIDTDVVIASGICEAVAARLPEDILLLPPIVYGFSPHHIDFPGVVTVGYHTFVEWVLDITRSMQHHGFRRFLLVNGHGSNRPVLDLAARMTIVEHPHVQCGAVSWWELSSVREAAAACLESQVVAHACEAETSLYLALQPEHVHMDRAFPDGERRRSAHFWIDLLDNPPRGGANPVHMTEYWSTVTDQGTMGDPTSSTGEKGLRLLAAAADELAAIVQEMKARPILPRVPHQGDA